MTDTFDIPSTVPQDDALEPGDCRAVHLGVVRLEDGRVFNGVVLEFPAGPPNLPISVIWDSVPLTLSVKTEQKA